MHIYLTSRERSLTQKVIGHTLVVGYCELSNGCRLFDSGKPGKILQSRYTVVLENTFLEETNEGRPVKEVRNSTQIT